MTRRQQLTPATIALHADHHGQSIDRSDPAVQRFMQECGLVSGPVHIRLTGDHDDLLAQIRRFELAFGSLVAFTTPRQQREGVLWDVYGTILA
jgi:hypothetical protein